MTFSGVSNCLNQSWVPYGGGHSILGIAPALYHPDPKTGLVVGFGSGDTLYSLALDKRLDKTACVELSRGQIELLKRESGRELFWQVVKIFNNPRVNIIGGDGRKYLLHSKEKFDLIEIDAIHPYAAYSGNLYSVEFFQLIKQHLKPGGIFCQWLPTDRVERTVLKAFPYVLKFSASFVLASNEPIKFNKVEIIKRLADLNLIRSFGPEKGEEITNFFTSSFPEEIRTGIINNTDFVEDINRDLFPKDEYFHNN
ncbi:MAG: hypothetical protein HZC48_06435 [Nitrospirae bacterium]|nr:hypothetical protein [Nitrospirota bacterium]